MNKKLIDLGLPSGTLWAAENEDGYFTFDEAVEKFGKSLPTKEQFEELIEHTDKYWDLQKKGMWFVSKHNDDKIFMPALGSRGGDCIYEPDYAFYWSATQYDKFCAHYLRFGSYFSNMCHLRRHYSLSIRLINSKQ